MINYKLSKLIRTLGVLPFVLLLLSGITHQAKATELMGLDMEWKSIGNDSFLLTVKEYRNCSTTYTGAPSLDIRSSCGTRTVKMTNTIFNDKQTPYCSSSCNPCNSSTCKNSYGYSLYEYQVKVDLSAERKKSCCVVNIDYLDCCIYNSYTNGLSDTLSQTMSIDICKASGLSSPVFTSPPIFTACKSLEYAFSNFTENHDSLGELQFALAPVNKSITKAMDFKKPYKYWTPFEFSGFPVFWDPLPDGLHTNENNGAIQFTPTKEGVYGFSSEIIQRHNGTIVGSTKRFYTAIIQSCSQRKALLTVENKSQIIGVGVSSNITYQVPQNIMWTDGFDVSLQLADSLSQLQFVVDKPVDIKYSITQGYIGPKKQQMNKSIRLYFFADSTIYMPGDTLSASIIIRGDVCPIAEQKIINLKLVL